MIRSAPICLAESTASKPTAPSPTTAIVMPGFTFAASAANQPVPRTSEVARRFGIISFAGTPGVGTRVHPQEEHVADEPGRSQRMRGDVRMTEKQSYSEGMYCAKQRRSR